LYLRTFPPFQLFSPIDRTKDNIQTREEEEEKDEEEKKKKKKHR
jgi:hypothetical protein